MKIKQLEWNQFTSRENDLAASSVVGGYTIRPNVSNNTFRLWTPGMRYNDAIVFETVEGAKVFSQEDFEKRIRSAIEISS